MTNTSNAEAKTSMDETEPTEAESKMTETIAKDRPTIDSAVKSFISMVCARSMAASGTDATHDKVMMGIVPALSKVSVSNGQQTNNTASTGTVPGENTPESKTDRSTSIQQQVLELARCILKAINSYTFPVHDTVAYSMAEKPGTSDGKKSELLEISVVARLWNGLVQSDQKPSRFLGRRALKLAWKNLDVPSFFPADKGNDIVNNLNTTNQNEQQQMTQNQVIDVRERQLEWLKQFEELLFSTPKPLPSDTNVNDDSALLWAPDGGAAELAKRRQRRLDAAKERGPRTPS